MTSSFNMVSEVKECGNLWQFPCNFYLFYGHYWTVWTLLHTKITKVTHFVTFLLQREEIPGYRQYPDREIHYRQSYLKQEREEKFWYNSCEGIVIPNHHKTVHQYNPKERERRLGYSHTKAADLGTVIPNQHHTREAKKWPCQGS